MSVSDRKVQVLAAAVCTVLTFLLGWTASPPDLIRAEGEQYFGGELDCTALCPDESEACGILVTAGHLYGGAVDWGVTGEYFVVNSSDPGDSYTVPFSHYTQQPEGPGYSWSDTYTYLHPCGTSPHYNIDKIVWSGIVYSSDPSAFMNASSGADCEACAVPNRFYDYAPPYQRAV